ncbi:MAG: hypothetical protein LBD68_04560 [Zoogloeaceae bacterium]|jgi:hypothetical protein|nr:hypothetical protein [Zoogloeaceae bacterium]
MWPQIFMLLLSMAVSYLTAPKTKAPAPASLSDFEFPQSTEGTAQIVVFGDVWIKDWMVVGVGNFRTSKIKTKSGK